MDTCQTSITTGILLKCRCSPHLKSTRKPREHHSGSHVTKQRGESQAGKHWPPLYVSYDESTETIIASYWSAQPTNLSVFRNRILSRVTSRIWSRSDCSPMLHARVFYLVLEIGQYELESDESLI